MGITQESRTGPLVEVELTVFPIMFLFTLPSGVAKGVPVRGPLPGMSPCNDPYDSSTRQRGRPLATLAIDRHKASTATFDSMPLQKSAAAVKIRSEVTASALESLPSKQTASKKQRFS